MSTETLTNTVTTDTAEAVTAPVLPADSRAGDGYDWMDTLESTAWSVLPNWASEGWDAGSWPYIIFAVARTSDGLDELENTPRAPAANRPGHVCGTPISVDNIIEIPADRTCPLHRLNRTADGPHRMACIRRCAYFLTQPIRRLPFGLRRFRRAQLRDAPPAGKKHGGGEG